MAVKYLLPYSFNVEWRGTPVTVECDAELDEIGLIMLPVAVFAGNVAVTPLVDVEAHDLQELVQNAYLYNNYRNEGEHDD